MESVEVESVTSVISYFEFWAYSQGSGRLENRTVQSPVQRAFRVSRVRRALILIMCFPLRMVTRLVPRMADRWRVTIRAAWLRSRLLTVRRISCLETALRVSAVLLRTRTLGPRIRVWVTVSCRCRFFDSKTL